MNKKYKPRIFISAGHSYRCPGYINKNLKLKEYQENAKIVKEIIELHKYNPLNSIYNLYTVPTGSLERKVAFVNKYSRKTFIKETPMTKIDFAIEVHLNAFNTKIEGFEICHYPNSQKSINLSKNLITSFSKYLPFKNRGFFERKDLYFLNYTKINAIICECLYLDNDTEASYLLHPKAHEIIARAILEGINEMYYV